MAVDSLTMNLFAASTSRLPTQETLGPGTQLLRGFAVADDASLLETIHAVADQAPFRHLVTPGGFRMSVAMTNCGTSGWITDRAGYRYESLDPLRGLPWPPLPASFLSLAQQAATVAGFPAFAPDACLVNRYAPGARMALHQDKDEQDFTAPIVSVSLGLPATFLFGGSQRTDKPRRVSLTHGDVVVWGGPDRLRFHGIAPLKDGVHPQTGGYRYNLTFRRAR